MIAPKLISNIQITINWRYNTFEMPESAKENMLINQGLKHSCQ